MTARALYVALALPMFIGCTDPEPRFDLAGLWVDAHRVEDTVTMYHDLSTDSLSAYWGDDVAYPMVGTVDGQSVVLRFYSGGVTTVTYRATVEDDGETIIGTLHSMEGDELPMTLLNIKGR